RELFMVQQGANEPWVAGARSRGTIQSVEGKLLEGLGPARGFEGRDWLWDPEQGGVLRDLMYHYAALCSHIVDADLVPERVTLRTRSDGRDVDSRLRPESAETYASVTGRSATGVAFSFEVGKYHSALRNERHFTVSLSDGSAKMLFNDPNLLVIRTPEAACEVALSG